MAAVAAKLTVGGRRDRRLDRLRRLRGGTLEPIELIRVVEDDVHDGARLRRQQTWV